jgi:hypothetical protein
MSLLWRPGWWTSLWTTTRRVPQKTVTAENASTTAIDSYSTARGIVAARSDGIGGIEALEQSLRVETIERPEAELGANLGSQPVGLGLEAAAERHLARSP